MLCFEIGVIGYVNSENLYPDLIYTNIKTLAHVVSTPVNNYFPNVKKKSLLY